MISSIKEEQKGGDKSSRVFQQNLISSRSDGEFGDFISQSEKRKSVVKDEERLTKDENLSTVGMMTVKSESMTYSSRVDSLVEKLSQVK